MNKSTTAAEETENSPAELALYHPPATEPAWLRPFVEQILHEAGGDASAGTPFCDFSALVRHLPMYGERTLRELVKREIIPSVRPPGSRKLAFHIPSVEASLLRHQKGGI
jgi:hypothetical protein